MIKLATMSEIKSGEIEQDLHLVPAIVDGNVVACFPDGKMLPHQVSAKVESSVEGFTLLTVTVEVRQ